MAGRVDEAAKKRRAANCWRWPRRRRARSPPSRSDATARVLFERRADDGRWAGHAEDHVLVAATRATRPRERDRACDDRGHGPEVADRVDRLDRSPLDPRDACRSGRDLPVLPDQSGGALAADCLFCGIADGEIPPTSSTAMTLVVAFRDINPKAPMHILVIPREHIDSAADADGRARTLLARLFA